jgi:hypothetical protein
VLAITSPTGFNDYEWRGCKESGRSTFSIMASSRLAGSSQTVDYLAN